MPATNTDELLAEVSCYLCRWRPSMAQSLRIAFIRRSILAVNPSADLSPETVDQLSSCFICVGVIGADGIELALLDQLSQAL